MKNLDLKLRFFKVGETSTYEGLMEIIGKESVICLDNEIIAKGFVVSDSILFMVGSNIGASFNKNNFLIEKVGESFNMKFKVDYGLSFANFGFSELAIIDSSIDMSRSEFQRCISLELIKKLWYEAQVSDEVETIK